MSHHTLVVLALFLLAASGCRLGYDERSSDASTDEAHDLETTDGDLDVSHDGDALIDAELEADADEVPDAEPDVDLDAELEADADEVSDADADADDEMGCVEGAVRCTGDDLERCVDGSWELEESCTLGCDAELERCLLFDPSNVPGSLLDEAVSSVIISDRVDVDTDDCDPAVFGSPEPAVTIVAGSDGLDLCVFIVDSLVVETSGLLVAVGDRGLVILASTDITLHGAINVGASGRRAGAGGGERGNADSDAAGSCGGTRGEHLDSFDSGGGGGGHGAVGGDASDSSSSGAEGGAGGPVTGTAELIPLTGGCGGGGGASDFEDGGTGGRGGGGGGAVQLSAGGEIVVELDGMVLSSGGGGEGGGRHSGGGGGGAGGSLLIEAPSVIIEGTIAANGGGGGGSDGGSNGDDGSGTDAPAVGGGSSGTYGGSGGVGGAGATPNGGLSASAANTGGGGGAGGRIRLNSASSVVLAGLISPSTPETFTEGPVNVR